MPTSLQVLILEDNPSDAELFLHELRQAGFDPKWQRVETEEEYLAALHPALDIILSDYSLPQFDFLSALRLLRARGLDLPFILVSGTIGEDIAVDCIKQGADDYLLKDRLARLGPAVKSALDQKRLRDERKQAEEALRNSEARYRTLFEQSPNGVLLIDLETGKAIEANETAHKQLGYTREEFAALRISDYEVLEKPEETARRMQKIIREGSDDFETLHRTKSGEIRNMHVWAKTVQLSGRSLFLAIFQDITERKQAEEALADSEKHFRALIENAPDGISLLGVDGKIAYASPATQHILGFAPEAVIGIDPRDYTHPDDLEPFLTLLNDLLQKPGGSFTTQYRFRHKDGSWRWLESTVSNLLAVPWVKAIVFNYRDITERKRAERAERENAERLKVALATIDLAVFNQDLDLRYTWMYQPQLGYTTDHVVGKTDAELLPPASARQVTEIKSGVLESGTSTRSEIEVVLNDRTYLYDLVVEPLRDASGEVVGIIGASLDITDRKRAEEALRHSEEHFRNIFENAPMGIYQSTPEGRYLSVNQAMAKIYGYASPEEMLTSVTDIAKQIHANPASRQEFKHRLAERGEIVEFINQNYRKDGSRIWTSTNSRVVKDNGGRFLYYEGFMIDITERKQAEERIETQLQRLAALRTIDTAITGSLDLRLVLDIVLEETTAQLNVDAASILLLRPRQNELEYAAGRGFRTKAFKGAKLRLGEGYAGRAALERHSVHIPNLDNQHDNPRLAKHLASEGFVAYYGLPLIAKGKVKGVLEVFQRAPLADGTDWVNFLETLAGQAAIAIDNTQLFDNLERSNVELSLAYDATIAGWSQAMDLRDKETEGHTQRVAEMSQRLARVMGIDEAELVNMRRGALLHDIGKMGVPDSILLKPDKLTDEEWVLMKKHPQFAFDMLSSIAYLKPALDIPYCHHEKWDGTGYPRGLKGEQIPLAARIFSVVDVWDALTSDRPYRPAWPKEKVREHIRTSSGMHFDPQVVEVFLKMPNKI